MTQNKQIRCCQTPRRINDRSSAIQIAMVLAGLLASTGGAWADYPNSVLDDLPIGYWRLNDARESSVAKNEGTRGIELDGVYSNGSAGAAGPSELGDGTAILGLSFTNIAFDTGATNTYVGVDDSLLSGLTEFTMSGWVRPRSLDGSRLGLFGQNDAIEFGFLDSRQLQLWTAGGGAVTWQFTDEVAADEWFHVAAVGTGSALELYINGNLAETGGAPIDGSYGDSSFPFRIGGGGIFDATGNEFRGTLDEVAVWDIALSDEQVLRHFDSALAANAPGDFNGDTRLDHEDVDLLIREIYEGSEDFVFDVTLDGSVDSDDLFFWVADLKATWFGDANLDGEFNSSDFVSVFVAGEYEDDIEDNSTWGEGDWNADLDFNTSDLVDALSEGGFEIGPTNALAAVPEPSSLTLLVVSACELLRTLRRRRIAAS